MNRAFAKLLGLTVVALVLVSTCSKGTESPHKIPTSTAVEIYPSLAQARDEGFHLLVGHPPFTVDFSSEVEGEDSALSYAWDFDGDEIPESNVPDPDPFTYTEPGEYIATLSVNDESERPTIAQQRVVVIGEPEWPEWRFGVTAHLDRASGLYASDAEVERSAQMIREANIEAVRLDLAWASVQPEGRDKYEWEDYDYLVDLSQRYGFDLLPIIGNTPKWASTASGASDSHKWNRAPSSPTEYAWFAYQAASRYKASIPAWEIWNEPNISKFWPPKPDPASYEELLRHAYLAIKYADPEAVVVLGGLANESNTYMPQVVSYRPEEFLQVVYDRGGGPFFDAVSRHPYTNPHSGTNYLVERLDRLRDIMAANGDNEKPIWLTEYGWPATPAAAVTEETQGEWLTQSLDVISAVDHVPVVFWYNFRDKGNNPEDPEHNYGLIEADWKTKPAYEAYQKYLANNSNSSP